MTTFPGSPTLLKAGFVCLTSLVNVESTIVFKYTPETLSRRLSFAADEAAELPGSPREPQEIITFRVVLDIVDKVEFPFEFPQAMRDGIYPQMSAME